MSATWEQIRRAAVEDIEATADWLQDPQRRRVQQKTLEAVERQFLATCNTEPRESPRVGVADTRASGDQGGPS